MEFDLSFLDYESRTCLQHGIDGVNKACVLHDPGAWNFVSAGKLVEANQERGYKKASEMDPIAVTVFDEMEQDGHSGGTASWVVINLTELAKSYRVWRTGFLVRGLTDMKKDINTFLEKMYSDKFGDDGEANWVARRERVLHDLEYSYLARHIIDDDAKRILQFLLKMEDVSHLGNEVVIEQIEEQLRIL